MDSIKKMLIEEMDSINLCYDRLQRVIEEMDSIKEMVDTENKTTKVPMVHDQVDVMANCPTSVVCKEFVVKPDEQMDTTSALASTARNEIMEKLVGGQNDFQVIPIGGMGGIGKTFLAKSIYTQSSIKERFDKCAWATISQQYNTREILCELLSQATNTKKEEFSGKSEDVLGLKLHKYLFGRRFLFVMDDIWSIDAWNKIQCFFPNNENGSRVLVTTRLFQLCSQLNKNYSFPMSFLDEASSWDLFSRTVFGEKSCPSVLKKIAEKIVANCRGLPLSIVVVGGLFRKMDDTLESWESIQDNLSSLVNMDNDKHCLRLLKMSYNHLPVYLKPCFLYMGVFEEDYEIRVSTLVKLWVSEGFVQPTNGESLETTARGILQDLVDRNLILTGKLGYTGSMKKCKIHDLVRDVCLKEGKIPLQAYEFDYYGHKSCVDSFAFRHVNLRHLAIASPSPFVPYLSLLWNLHTLIVSGSYNTYLLHDIWKMPQFRHIEFVNDHFSLPDPPSVVQDEDIVMENLHTLKGVMNFKCSEGVVKRIPSIKKLELRYHDGLLGIHDNKDMYCFGNIKSLCGLESLSLSHVMVRECNIYMQKLTFPHSLKKLSICMEPVFEWQHTLEKIGSLPLLEKLKLSYGCCGRGKWEIAEGQFPSLKYLLLCNFQGLENWTASKEDSSILPRLEHLHLRGLVNLKEIPLELGNIDTLKKIEVSRCGEGAVRSVKEMFDEQVELHGGEDQLSFHVQVHLPWKNKHLLSLAGPNFYVNLS